MGTQIKSAKIFLNNYLYVLNYSYLFI